MHYGFYKRYLTQFSSVTVCARITALDGAPDEDLMRVDGPGVSAHDMPDYRGPRQFLTSAVHTIRAARRAGQQADIMLLRIPGNVGILTWLLAPSRLRGVYGVEVVGDPWDAFGRGVIDHPLRPLFRIWLGGFQRLIVRRAKCVGYVTEKHLQGRYPARRDAFVTNYSSVALEDDMFRLEKKVPVGTLRLVAVGSLDQPYKGIDTILKGVARVNEAGVRVHLTVVGGGVLQKDFERVSDGLGLSRVVRFMGQLSPTEVIDMLDCADILVSASKTEGIARSAIEGMARSLPVVGTPVGGMKEILASNATFRPGDAEALSLLLLRGATDREWYRQLVEHSQRTAASFRDGILQRRRSHLYSVLKDRKKSTWR